MNKTFLFASALLCAGCFIASCSNDDEEIVNVQPTNKTVTIHAGISEDAATRIALGESVDGKTKVLWSAGDAFSLINGENTYTFSRAADDTEEMASADFSYTGTETLPDLSTAGLSFSYPATGVPTNYAYQTGTEEGLSDYMVMTATIPEGASWDNLHLSFKHNTAVVKITLTNEVFKDKDVIVSLNATGLLEYSTFITSDALAADGNGTVTAYFAVPATDELSDCRIIASCEDIRYKTRLGAKAITAGKLYTINKTDEQLTEMTSHLLPTGEEFCNGLSAYCNATSSFSIDTLKFVTNSEATGVKELYADVNGVTSCIVRTANCVEIHTAADEFIANENCKGMFYSFRNLITLDLTGVNTEKVQNMESMFAYCEDMTSLNINSFCTKNVTDMNCLFMRCNSLKSINLKLFDTRQVTNMKSMFLSTASLTTLDLSHFKTNNVTNMRNMFSGCSSLVSLDASSFNTEQVITMLAMFSECSSLTTLDVSSFDTKNDTTMASMFRDCSSLTSLDLGNFNTEKVVNMALMFSGCTSLTSLNVTSFNTENVAAMKSMFNGCESLSELDIENFSFASFPTVTNMFTDFGEKTAIAKCPVKVSESGFIYLTQTTTDCDRACCYFVKSDGTKWE